MDISLDIPSEHSHELTPMQSIHIEMSDHEQPPVQSSLQSTDLAHKSFRRKKTQAGKSKDSETTRRQMKPDNLQSPTYLQPQSSDSDDEEESMYSYKLILLRDIKSDRLVQKFINEPYGLINSKIEATDFSITACFTRLASIGYRVMLINYMTYQVEEVTIKVNHLELQIHHGVSGTSVKFEKLSGVMLGDQSSTFYQYRNLGGDLRKYSISSTDCMSILGEFQSYDIATLDDQAKYDIYLLVSWKISAQALNGSLIPLSHGQIATQKIKMKLRAVANSRYLFLHELLLLGILKSLIEMGESEQKINTVKLIIDRMFRLPEKLFRICSLMKPPLFMVSHIYKNNIDDRLRKIKLQKRLIEKIRKSDERRWNAMKKLIKMKTSILNTYQPLDPEEERNRRINMMFKSITF